MKIRRPTHATVVAYLALFVALGGSAYAVSKVGTDDLRRNAVTSAKIRNGAVGAADLAKLRIRRREFTVTPANDQGALVVTCGKRERIISGAGGWLGDGSVTDTSIGGNALEVRGAHPGGGTLFAEALCLRK